MLKLDFSKYTEEFKEKYYRYFNAELNNEEVYAYFGEISNIGKDKAIKNQLKNLLKSYAWSCNERKLIIQIKCNLKRILTSSINFLRDFYNEVKSYPALNNEFLVKELGKIFVDYAYEQKISKMKIAYKLIEVLNIKTCPYCNENLAYTAEGINIRPQLDHFFPKHKYPFFAISLANLIPSCPICNHKKGKSFNESFKSPFEINSFEDFQFTFILDIELKALTEIKLKEIEKNIKEIDFIIEIRANNELLSLKERYQNHKDIVAEIIQKQRLVNYYKEKMDSNVLGTGFPSSEEEYRLIHCSYYPISEEEFLKRPLSKLTFDIHKEVT